MLRLIDDFEWTSSTAPISIEDFKAYCRINVSAEDSFLEDFLRDAIETIEAETGKCILTRTWAEDVAGFNTFYAARNPVLSVSEITYYDADDQEQALPNDNFILTKSNTGKAEIEFLDTLPALSSYRTYPVTITYVAGMTSFKPYIEQAIKAYAGFKYRNRFGEEDPKGIDRVLSRLRNVWLV